jgi:hypothetical protein
MIIKALILTTLLSNDPTTMIIAMPQTKVEKIEARKRGKRSKGDHRRGGRGLR